MTSNITVCVPFMKVHKKHLDHFTEWYALNKARHGLELFREYWQALHKVQGQAVKMARASGHSHILFTEDDHWGYPAEGLARLLDHDKDVVAFPSYFKDYPYNSFAMNKGGAYNLISGDKKPLKRVHGVGVQKVDFITWAFTLVRVDVFDRMEAAGLTPFAQWGPVPSDSYFCQYCEDLGIDIHVDFSHVIAHGDIGPDDRPAARRMFESAHPKVVNVVLRDDWGHPYGDYENLNLSAHFLGRNGANTADDAGLKRTWGHADLGPHDVKKFDVRPRRNGMVVPHRNTDAGRGGDGPGARVAI